MLISILPYLPFVIHDIKTAMGKYDTAYDRCGWDWPALGVT